MSTPWQTFESPLRAAWAEAVASISARMTEEMRPVVERLLSMQGGADESGPWYPLFHRLGCPDGGDAVCPDPLSMLKRVALLAERGIVDVGWHGIVRWNAQSLTAWMDYLDESEWAEPRRGWTLGDWGFEDPESAP